MKQVNNDPKPRAYGVAMAICAQFPQFNIVDNYENRTDGNAYTLRRPDGAGLHVYHHVGYPKGKRNIAAVVEKVPEAPYGLDEPRADWGQGTGKTNEEIAFDFAMNYYEAMQQYWFIALNARQKALDDFNERLAFARELAKAGDGTARYSDRNTSPGHVPSPCSINCYANKTASWTVKHFGQETELHIRATDTQALAIVAMLAKGTSS